MSGSAILNPDVLVDDLVTDVIDGLREELHPAFGVRPYRVFTVKRVWSGTMVGDGSYTDTEVELTPQPKVTFYEGWGRQYGREQMACGYQDAGAVKLTEVSLTYTQEELLCCAAADDATQHFIKITEANGQAQAAKFFVYNKTPHVDREKDMGWVCYLDLAEDQC